MWGDILGLLFILFMAFLVMGALSPLEALGWWAGWFENHPEPLVIDQSKDYSCAIIFLTGIHSVSDETYARREIQFLEMLKERLPQALVLEVFPYAATNQALTGQRFFAWFWRIALKLKQGRLPLAGMIINVRNIWQVAVSADKRYGPIYNQATAEAIKQDLQEHGYIGKVPVYLIGYSGGGQIAVGAAHYLPPLLQAPVSVISLGGILCADPGLLGLKKFYHLAGNKDWLQHLGTILFPGRWPILGYSPWFQAKQKGLIEVIPMGPMDHTGRNGYLDHKAQLPSGESFLQKTVEVVVNIIGVGGQVSGVSK